MIHLTAEIIGRVILRDTIIKLTIMNRRSRFYILLLTCIFVLPLSLNGQVSSILKNRVKSEASKEADKKVEKKAASIRDRLLGTIADEESMDTLQVEEGNGGTDMPVQPVVYPMKGLFAAESQVKHKDVYSFDGKIVMEMEASDEESEFEGIILYTTFINTSNNDFAFDIQTVSENNQSAGEVAMSMVYDNENSVVIRLTNTGEDKVAIVTGFEDEDFMEEEEDDYSYAKTGKTKTIIGYKCDEYQVEEEGGSVSIWVSREVPFKPNREQLIKTGLPVQFDGPNGEGMIMEMESYKDGVKTGSMIVKEINERASKTISLAGYSFLNMDAPQEK